MGQKQSTYKKIYELTGTRAFKVVVLGGAKVGKTSLIMFYGTGEFPAGYTPSLADNYGGKLDYDGEQIDLTITDSQSDETYDAVRPLTYNNTHAFVICFNLIDKKTLMEVETKWKKEVKNLGPYGVPIILVGCQADLRDSCSDTDHKQYFNCMDEVSEIVTTEEGLKCQEKNRFYAYLECSAIKRENCEQVFAEAVKGAMQHQKDME